jgi:DNA repair photolyase
MAESNMYDFITKKFNPVRGKCSHGCAYCYMKRWPNLQPIHLDEKELNRNLGEGEFYFVCSGCDLFANDVKLEWIDQTLAAIKKYPLNKYLIQTKAPVRMSLFIDRIPTSAILGTTLETNRPELFRFSGGDWFSDRSRIMNYLSEQFPVMITIEPIMDFDLELFVELIQYANPIWVNIGADSGRNGLPEPSAEKIGQLIERLKMFTHVKIKKNLGRLYNEKQ